jgi:hypothetical protein
MSLPVANADQKPIGEVINESSIALASQNDLMIDALKSITVSLNSIFETIVAQLKLDQNSALKDAEALKERGNLLGASTTDAAVDEKLTFDPMSLLQKEGLLLLILWLADLDTWIRSLKMAEKLTELKAGFVIFKSWMSSLKTMLIGLVESIPGVKNFMLGFKNVGKVMGAVTTPVAIAEFQTAAGRFGAVLGEGVIAIKESGSLFRTGITNLKMSLIGVIEALPFMENFLAGVRNVGKVMAGAVATPVSIAEFSTFAGKFGAIVGEGMNALKSVGTFFKEMGIIQEVVAVGKSAFAGAGSILKGIVNIFSKIGGFLSKISGLSKIMPFLKVLGGPFTMIIFSMFDFISGFLKGFEEGGLAEGLKQGGLEIVRGMITKPLDLLKDIVSWAAEKLGFENFSKDLDSFSFTDLFNKMVIKIENIIPLLAKWFTDLFNDPVAAIKKLAGPILDWITKFPTKMYNSLIKPAIDWIKKLFNVEKFSAAIPDMPKFDFGNPMAKIGEILGELIQKIAEIVDNFASNDTSQKIADWGVEIARDMGAQSIKRYNASDNAMETIQVAPPPQTGTALGAAGSGAGGTNVTVINEGSTTHTSSSSSSSSTATISPMQISDHARWSI